MKPGLADLPNIVIVPHIASASMWTRSGMVSQPVWERQGGGGPASRLITAIDQLWKGLGSFATSWCGITLDMQRCGEWVQLAPAQ
jgi:hypothetical protein